jgi:glutathione S-transferase
MTPQGEPFAAAIDGQDASSWRLPLPPLSATSSPEAYSPGEQPHLDRLAAAARLVRREPACGS